MARWSEPTAVELPAVTADNLSKVGTLWFGLEVVSMLVPPPDGVFVMGVSSGRADWQGSTVLVIGGLGLVSMYGKPVAIQSGLLSSPTMPVVLMSTSSLSRWAKPTDVC